MCVIVIVLVATYLESESRRVDEGRSTQNYKMSSVCFIKKNACFLALPVVTMHTHTHTLKANFQRQLLKVSTTEQSHGARPHLDSHTFIRNGSWWFGDEVQPKASKSPSSQSSGFLPVFTLPTRPRYCPVTIRPASFLNIWNEMTAVTEH